MTYLYDDLNYVLQSEPELGRGYADLVMTVQAALDAASTQVQTYAARLRRMIGVGEKLRCVVVAAVGFERLVWRCQSQP